MVSGAEVEVRGLGNYAIWKSGSGQAIISSSSLFWPLWLPSKDKQRPLVVRNKGWLLETTSKAEKQV